MCWDMNVSSLHIAFTGKWQIKVNVCDTRATYLNWVTSKAHDAFRTLLSWEEETDNAGGAALMLDTSETMLSSLTSGESAIVSREEPATSGGRRDRNCSALLANVEFILAFAEDGVTRICLAGVGVATVRLKHFCLKVGVGGIMPKRRLRVDCWSSALARIWSGTGIIKELA